MIVQVTRIRAKSISGSRLLKPCSNAAGVRRWNSGLVADSLAEEIGIATEIFDWGERDGFDPVLDYDVPGRRKTCDPMSEGSDKIAKCGGGLRAVDPAVPFG